MFSFSHTLLALAAISSIANAQQEPKPKTTADAELLLYKTESCCKAIELVTEPDTVIYPWSPDASQVVKTWADEHHRPRPQTMPGRCMLQLHCPEEYDAAITIISAGAGEPHTCSLGYPEFTQAGTYPVRLPLEVDNGAGYPRPPAGWIPPAVTKRDDTSSDTGKVGVEGEMNVGVGRPNFVSKASTMTTVEKPVVKPTWSTFSGP